MPNVKGAYVRYWPKADIRLRGETVANDPKQRVRLVTAAVQAFTLRATGPAQTIISGQHDRQMDQSPAARRRNDARQHHVPRRQPSSAGSLR